MRSLLIHADDLGLSEGVSAGILEAIRRGVVTATSAMVCDPEHRVRVARLAPGLQGRVGLHLQLTGGLPLSSPASVPTLLDGDGRFPAHRDQLGALNPDEVLLEWRAQLAAIRGLGVEPSHLDTHHSVHALPRLADVYLTFAREAGIPARGGGGWFNRWMAERGAWCADAYICLSTQPSVSAAVFDRVLRVAAAVTAPEGSVEISCHPAVVDKELQRRSRYVERRAEELSLLTSPGLPGKLRALGFRLVPPAELPRRVVKSGVPCKIRRSNDKLAHGEGS